MILGVKETLQDSQMSHVTRVTQCIIWLLSEVHPISFVFVLKRHKKLRDAELPSVTVNSKGPKNKNKNSQRQGRRQTRDTERSRPSSASLTLGPHEVRLRAASMFFQCVVPLPPPFD